MCGCGRTTRWTRRGFASAALAALPAAACAGAAVDLEAGRLRQDGAAVPFRPSPNRGGTLAPRCVVLHYTETTSPGVAIDWLTRPASRASAHLVIDRAGGIVQLVPLDRIAWHAGDSRWGDWVGLNRVSIGIEFVNAGPLVRSAGQWRTGPYVVPASEVVEDGAGEGWQDYPEVQLEAGLRVLAHLAAAFPVEAVLAHSAIAPARRRDPGPAFPIARFRHVLGA